MDECCECCERPAEFDDFVKTIQFDKLCTAAANIRGGISCELDNHILGGKYEAILGIIMRNEKQY